MRGGIDAIYDDMSRPIGLGRVGTAMTARGRMFSARHRAGRQEAPVAAPVIAESALYDDAPAAEEPVSPT
jgi:hypothetical protein